MPTRTSRAPAPVVLSVGGSVLVTGKDDAKFLASLAELVRSVGRDQPLVVTTGGGRTAREYIGLGRDLRLTEIELDELGIEVTRLHARLLAAAVGAPAPAVPPTTLAQAVHEAHRTSPVILGGTEPGHTTDAVAALLAARLRAARVVNATNVDGVYDRDPKGDPSARRFDALAWPEFRARVAAATDGTAGQQYVFDRLGADTLARAGIPLLVVDGRDLPNLRAALEGRPFRGTRIG